MTSADSSQVDQRFLANSMASFIQIGAVVVLAMWCFKIVAPFLNVIIWGLIISVALYPLHVRLTARLSGREKLSATLLVLAGLAIIQLPPILVLGPIAIWVFSVLDGLPATIFLVYAIIVSASDAFLKPLLLGRGVDVPMLVILVGAIGGAISQGIIGLFIGAVVLALGYKLVTAWMAPDQTEPEIDQQAV